MVWRKYASSFGTFLSMYTIETDPVQYPYFELPLRHEVRRLPHPLEDPAQLRVHEGVALDGQHLADLEGRSADATQSGDDPLGVRVGEEDGGRAWFFFFKKKKENPSFVLSYVQEWSDQCAHTGTLEGCLYFFYEYPLGTSFGITQQIWCRSSVR